MQLLAHVTQIQQSRWENRKAKETTLSQPHCSFAVLVKTNRVWTVFCVGKRGEDQRPPPAEEPEGIAAALQ